jgi:hypothetical protein
VPSQNDHNASFVTALPRDNVRRGACSQAIQIFLFALRSHAAVTAGSSFPDFDIGE